MSSSDPHLPPDARLFLRGSVRVERREGQVASLASRLHRYAIAPEDAAIVADVLGALRPSRTLADVARACGRDLEEVEACARPLFCEGLLGDRSDAAIPALLFFAHARSSPSLWFSGEAACVAAIHDGTATAHLLLGMLLEEWHFIKINPSHISAAVQHARSPVTQQLWSRFLAEEYPHGDWLKEGLLHVLAPRELDASHPLESTLALCNQIRWVARTNELAYAVCLALAERGPDDPADSGEATLYRKMRSLHLLPDATFEPYIRHALTDEGEDHLALTRVPFELAGPLRREQREAILRHVFDHVRCYEANDAQIHAWYAGGARGRYHALPDDLAAASGAA